MKKMSQLCKEQGSNFYRNLLDCNLTTHGMTHNVFIDIKTKIRKYSGNPKTGFFQFSNGSKVSDMNQISAKQGANSKFCSLSTKFVFTRMPNLIPVLNFTFYRIYN